MERIIAAAYKVKPEYICKKRNVFKTNTTEKDDIYQYRIGSPYFDTLDNVHPDWTDCDRYRRPTYGEVIDWFSSRGVHLTFENFFTFALRDRVAYFWKISYIDESGGDLRLATISEESESVRKANDAFGGSFDLDAKAEIRSAMTRFPMQS